MSLNNRWIFSLALVAVIAQTRAFSHGPKPEADGVDVVHDEHRREFLGGMLLTTAAVAARPIRANAGAVRRDATREYVGIRDPDLRDYHDPSLPNWKGTSLPGPLSLFEACVRLVDSDPVLSMGRWPDPILRRPASNVPPSVFRNKNQLEQLRLVARALRNTARREGAVGLAAQQCGVDASLIYIEGLNSVKSIGNARDDGRYGGLFGNASSIGVLGESDSRKSRNEVSGEGRYNRSLKRSVQNSQRSQQGNGIYLVNPRIIRRSPESEMMVWTEQCLVLPPEFRASLLRDAEVTIEYESLDDRDMGLTKQIKLRGELARCAQHEMDHDRGILIVDHVSLDELLSVNRKPLMADIENADGSHARRMQRAYSREVIESSLLPKGQAMVSLSMEDNMGFHARVTQHEHPHFFVQAANAMDLEESDSSSPIMNILRQSKDQYSPTEPVTSEISAVCKADCLEERKRVAEQRRAMMQQSRSNTRRADVLELAQQRALMYGTGFQGLPPRLCSGFCP
jgi:peptide deformylase